MVRLILWPGFRAVLCVCTLCFAAATAPSLAQHIIVLVTQRGAENMILAPSFFTLG